MKNSPIPPPGPLLTGLFREKRRYSTWRSHGTKDWLLIYTLGGKGRFGYLDGEFIATAHDLILFKPGTLHDYGLEPSLRRWDLLWAHFIPRQDWLDWLSWPEISPGLLHIRLSGKRAQPRILDSLMRTHRLATSHHRRREVFGMNSLETTLLWTDEVNPLSDQATMDDRIRQTLVHIAENLSDELDLESLAQHCGLSLSRFAHLFKEQIGNTPQRYLENQRLTRARQLLEGTSQPISEIAYEVGFENPFYFSLRFKRLMGKSPRTHRKTKQK